jgi:hypothetical protein
LTGKPVAKPKMESVVSDEAMIGVLTKKSPVRKPNVVVKPKEVKPVPQNSVEILTEMVNKAKSKREIRDISHLAYTMAGKNRRYAAVSKLADQKLCDIYGVR